jgi:multiple sugar transport system permease protein
MMLSRQKLFDKIRYIPVLIILLVLAFFLLTPVIWMILSAFKSDVEIVAWPPSFWPQVFTMKNLAIVQKRIEIFEYVKNSTIYAVGTTIPTVFVNSLAGYAFARLRFKGKNVLFILFLATMMIPFQVVMVPLFLEVYFLGWLNTYAGLILPRIASAFWIFLSRSAFANLPKELEDAGRVDGLTEFGIYFRIMLPLVKPAMITVVLLSISGCWNDLLWPMIIANASSMRTLSNGLALFVGDWTTEYGPAFFGAMVSMVPMLVLYIFGQRYFVAGQVTSGIKG